ncbi:MAG: hypothetical protein WD000_05345 [Thermodesulfobacteriota bacterium]
MCGGGDNGGFCENEADFFNFEPEIGIFERQNSNNELNFVVLDKNEPEWQLAA